jgi:soluble lytic murein transglycosylase-like protein
MQSMVSLINYWILSSCIDLYSSKYNIDKNLVNAVISVESRFNSQTIGSVGEVGLMQIRPVFVIETHEQLLDPCTNVHRGIQLLNSFRNTCKHKTNNTFIICYNRGNKGGSYVSNPYDNNYYKKVMYEYNYR